MVKNDRLASTQSFEKDFGPIVCFDFTHDRSPIAVKPAQIVTGVVVLWLDAPAVRGEALG
jgi:hypothetical protein